MAYSVTRKISPHTTQNKREQHTLPDKVSLRNALFDLGLVCEVCFATESTVQATAEVVVALWVVAAEVEKFCEWCRCKLVCASRVAGGEMAWVRGTLVDGYDLPPQLGIGHCD